MDRMNEFMDACRHGNLQVLQKFLESTESEAVDVNYADDDGNTALHVAATNGQESAIILLLRHGALVERSNGYGWTPLMQAARQGHTSIANLLIRHGANVNATNKLGMTPLLCAVRSGVLACVRFLATNGAYLSTLSSELTPLMVAAQYGFNSIVKYLVDAGLDVNQTTKIAGYNALMFASSNGHKGTAQLLMEFGANVKSTNVGGKNAHDIAIAKGRKQVRRFLSNNMTNDTSDACERAEQDIFEAIHNDNMPSVHQFLTDDPSVVNRPRKLDGMTPLSYAAMLGDVRAIEYLLSNGALVDVRESDSGWTPLMRAVGHERKEAAMFLLQNGADCSLVDRDGNNAFEIGALGKADLKLLRALTPLYKNVSQTLPIDTSIDVTPGGAPKPKPVLGLAVIDFAQTWTKQLGDYYKKFKIKKAKSPEASGLDPFVAKRDVQHPAPEENVAESSRAHEESRNPSDIKPVLETSVKKLMSRLNTASPCSLAPPSQTLKPIVMPFLTPYLSDNGRPKMPDTITLPESFPMESRQKVHSPQKSKDASSRKPLTSTQVTFDPAIHTKMKDELRDILRRLSLEKYYPLFLEQEVDASSFPLLDECDLRSLGIEDDDDCKKLMTAILGLRISFG